MAQSVPLPTREILLSLFRYEPETGKLFWRERTPDMFENESGVSTRTRCNRWNARFAGCEAFITTRNGYLCAMIDGQPCLAHRVIWKIMTGEEPDQIDHIDGNRTNNRWGNHRNVTCTENRRNVAIGSGNTSGALGVGWHKATKKWRAIGTKDGRQVALGYFHDINEAIAKRMEWQRENGFHENHGRKAA